MNKCHICGEELGRSSAVCENCGIADSDEPANPNPGFLKVDELGATLPLSHKYSLAPGAIFAERYRVEAFVGQGGMGAVYRVLDISTGRQAALKMMSPTAAAEQGFSERFAREIQLLARLSHPSIPKILSAGVAEIPYFVTEYINGQTLRKQIDKTGSLSAERVTEVGAAIADALAVAHSHGVIHRDIKPQNIMVGQDGNVFLIDFGIARATGPEMKSLTETGMLLGTPHYMAPEQIESHRVDERSDIYSLGVVLFEAVTGRVPFSGTTPFAVAKQHTERQPPRPRSIKADIPPSLEHLILRCLDKNPSRRPWSATELATLLRKPQKLQIKRRRMPNGDKIEEAPAEIFGYCLRLISQSEKKGWSPGMALHLEQVLYKLVEVIPQIDGGKTWDYRFTYWPQEEILRRLVDYDSEVLAEVQKSTPLRWLQKIWR